MDELKKWVGINKIEWNVLHGEFISDWFIMAIVWEKKSLAWFILYLLTFDGTKQNLPFRILHVYQLRVFNYFGENEMYVKLMQYNLSSIYIKQLFASVINPLIRLVSKNQLKKITKKSVNLNSTHLLFSKTNSMWFTTWLFDLYKSEQIFVALI